MEKKKKRDTDRQKAYNLEIISVLKAKSCKESPITVKTIQNEINKTFYAHVTEKGPDLKTIRSRLADIMWVISQKSSLFLPGNNLFWDPDEEMPQLGFTIECCIKDKKGNFIPYYEIDSDDHKSTTKYYYYEHILDEDELSLLIEGVETNTSKNTLELQSLVRRIASLSPVHMHNYLTKRYYIKDNKVVYFYQSDNLKKLKELISEKKLVSIIKCYYNTNHEQTTEDVEEPYKVLPVRTINIKGYCYLEAISYDPETDKSSFRYFRLDQIIINDKGQKMTTLQKKIQYNHPEDKSKLKVSEYRFPYPVMVRGENQDIMMHVSNTHEMLNILYDFFGDKANIHEDYTTPSRLIVSVNAPVDGIKAFAKQYCTEVKIKYPKKLAEEVKEDLKKALEMYEK